MHICIVLNAKLKLYIYENINTYRYDQIRNCN